MKEVILTLHNPITGNTSHAVIQTRKRSEVIGWKGLMENGKPVEFSKEKFDEIMNKYPWLAEEVHAALYLLDSEEE